MSATCLCEFCGEEMEAWKYSTHRSTGECDRRLLVRKLCDQRFMVVPRGLAARFSMVKTAGPSVQVGRDVWVPVWVTILLMKVDSNDYALIDVMDEMRRLSCGASDLASLQWDNDEVTSFMLELQLQRDNTFSSVFINRALDFWRTGVWPAAPEAEEAGDIFELE